MTRYTPPKRSAAKTFRARVPGCKPSAADMLRQALAPPREDGPPEWFDLAIAVGQAHKDFESEREAKKQAEEAARTAPTTAAGMLAAEISGKRNSTESPLPLNGAALLRAALNGGSGTINGAK